MPQLTSIKLEDGTVIYIESSEDVNLPKGLEPMEDEEEPLISKGDAMDSAVQKIKSIEGMIRSYTANTLNAFKEIATANVDKVTLEFGIKIGGEAGIPYITKGTAESNLKIIVECSFPNKAPGTQE